jgi:hypothetical protein
VLGPERALDRRVNLCCVLPNPDGDTKRIHGGLSWFRQRRPYVQWEESIVFPCTEVLVYELQSVREGAGPKSQERRKMECYLRC